MTSPLSSRDRFVLALTCQPVDRAPAWMMRQAGRYLPEYRELRARHEFLDCVRDPELAAELTLQPLRRFAFDAGIIFSDILVVLEAMGLRVTFPAGGPRIHPTLEDLELGRLRPVVAGEAFAYVADALALVRRGIESDERIAANPRALLGFAGSPFTLACYAIEGGGSSREFATVRMLLRRQPEAFDALLRRITAVVGDLLVLQVRAGADAVQIFDTWGGLLDARDWRARVQPHVTTLVERVHAVGGRCLVFAKDSSHLVDALLETGCDGIGVDWRADMRHAATRAAERPGRRAAVQGNLDPTMLFAPPADIRAAVGRIREAVGGRTGHVLNLGHGVLPTTPVEGVEAFVEAATQQGPGP